MVVVGIWRWLQKVAVIGGGGDMAVLGVVDDGG